MVDIFKLRFYNKIAFWENRRRLKKLIYFRELISIYVDNSRYEWQADGVIEDESASKARIKINHRLFETHNIILSAGITTIVRYEPPPVIGGFIQNIDIMLNLFELYTFKVSYKRIFDLIDRAIGIYESDFTKSLIRTFNPIHYLGLVAEYVAKSPFLFASQIGFDSNRIETSIFGRVLKGIIYLITATASLLTIFHLLGILNYIIHFFINLFHPFIVNK